jgi:sugar phosphate permease
MSVDYRSAAAITGAEKGSVGGPIGSLIGAAFGAATAKKPVVTIPWYENPKYLAIVAGIAILLIVVVVEVKR